MLKLEVSSKSPALSLWRKTVSDLFLPIGGEILEVNPQLEEHPELVNQDPYGEGWIIKLKPTDASELDDLLDAAGYKEIINE